MTGLSPPQLLLLDFLPFGNRLRGCRGHGFFLFFSRAPSFSFSVTQMYFLFWAACGGISPLSAGFFPPRGIKGFFLFPPELRFDGGSIFSISDMSEFFFFFFSSN